MAEGLLRDTVLDCV